MSNKQQRKDIISSLPDSILCHILSFLPTNNTVTTSILSKRWKPLWLSVSTLNFTNHSTYIETTDLLSRVYSVMISRHNALPIQIFKLKCSRTKDNDSNDITQLITTAIQRGTQTLHLNGRFDFLDMKLASNIFTCRTLTVLKLKYLTIKDLPQMNDKISPIKTLYLDNIFMYDRTKLINFLLLFPILEELQTNGVRLLTCLSPCPRFVPTTEDMIKCLPNLVKAKLSDNEHIPLFLLSKALTTLSIKLTYHYSVHVPIFNNLTQMEIFFDLYWKKNWTEKWMWILEMLQHSSKLQYLIIHDKEKEKPIYIEEKDEWEEPKIVPECLSSHLRTCLYSNFRGNKCEFQFIQYVMSNSKVLSKMTIHSASSLDLKAKHQMLQKLSVFPRGCKLIFE